MGELSDEFFIADSKMQESDLLQTLIIAICTIKILISPGLTQFTLKAQSHPGNTDRSWMHNCLYGETQQELHIHQHIPVNTILLVLVVLSTGDHA